MQRCIFPFFLFFFHLKAVFFVRPMSYTHDHGVCSKDLPKNANDIHRWSYKCIRTQSLLRARFRPRLYMHASAYQEIYRRSFDSCNFGLNPPSSPNDREIVLLINLFTLVHSFTRSEINCYVSKKRISIFDKTLMYV